MTALFDAAGKPTLRSVANAASARVAAAGGNPVTLQRISDWRSGKAIPAEFDSLVPVLLTLIEKAARTGHTPAPELVKLTAWRAIWRAAQAWDPQTEAICPFPGLAAYGPEDRERFFGRAEATAELVNRVVGPAAGMIVVLGASGAGKSSLLHAGVIPTLCADREWTVVTMTPGTRPAKTLAELLSPSDANAAARPDLVVVDQFEETFTVCLDESEREDFSSRLAELAAAHETTRTVVILAVRADFVAHCLTYPVLADALNTRCYALGPMRVEELTEAITGPARATGLNLEPGLAELVVTELCGLAGGHHRRSYDPGGLPLFSHVMAATWRHRAGARLTVAGYRKAGGVAGSVTATAEEAWHGLTAAEQTAAKELLMGLVTVGSDGRDTRRRVPSTELLARTVDPDAAQTALTRLIDARLITADSVGAADGESGAAQEIVCFTHEIVLDAWPRLHAWIDEGRVDLLVRQRVELDAAEWVAAQRDPALLYQPARLAAAEKAAGTPTGAVGEFLTAAQAVRRRGRRLAVATRVGLALVGVVVLVLGIAAYTQTRLSEQEHENADLVAILAEADSVRSTDPSLSAQLELVADRIRPGDPDIRSRLLRIQNLPLAAPLRGHTGAVHQVAYRPDGHVLASAGEDGAVRLWNVADIAHPVSSGAPLDCGKPATATAFSPDGTLLGAACGTGIRLWNVSDPAHPDPWPSQAAGKVTDFVFGPDGRTLAATDGTSVTLWNLGNPAAPVQSGRPLTTTDPVASMAFAPSGRLAVAGSHTVQIWTLGPVPGPLGAPITVPGPGIQAMALSRDGTTLAVGGGDNALMATGTADATVTMWDIAIPDRPAQFGSPLVVDTKSELRSLAFDPEGNILAVGGRDNVTLWTVVDRAHPTRLGEPLAAPSPPCQEANVFQPCRDSPNTLAFAADGHTVAVGAQGSLRLWSLPPAVIGGRIGWFANRAAISAVGTMVTSVVNGRLELWDIRDRRSVRPLADLGPGPSADGFIPTPTLSLDGRLTVATAGPNAGLQLLDISDPVHIRPLYQFPDAIGIGFNGRILVEILPALHLRLWDLSDPAHPVATIPPTKFGTDPISGSPCYVNIAGHLLVTLAPDENAKGELEYMIKFWDLTRKGEAREIQRIPSDPARPFYASVLTPDGRTMVTLAENTLRVWDISSPGLARPLGDPIIAHAFNIQSVDFNADATLMATSSADSTVRLWDFRDRAHPQPIGRSITMPSRTTWNLNLDVAADRLIGVGSGVMSIWDLDENETRQRICDITRDALTREVWAAHLPQLPYHPPCPEAR
ncbi:hypothetical protein [Nocardia sp. NPDC004604]|uniref:nSTAND1 domain-containing NTPase n=1 Tax=Nocardia sp. NPDC004604 TaxID=3157013 RepID=UPI0033BC41E1